MVKLTNVANETRTGVADVRFDLSGKIATIIILD